VDNIIIVVMTVAHAKPERQVEVVRALSDVAKAARAEDGCIEYRVFRSSENAMTSVNYERWSSNEAREAFLAGPAVMMFVAAIDDAFTEPPQPVAYEEIG
jgi:quinol monooxygenase YgiN